jgi:hypothetical protein
LIFLDEMAGRVDEVESAASDETVESVRLVDWYPGVRGSPHDQGGNLDVGVEGFDLVGVALVSLGDLSVERRLPDGSEPGRYQRLVDIGSKSLMAGTGDVLAHERLVQIGRKLREDI